MVDEIVAHPELSGDERVRVFRRAFTGMEEYAGMTVDAYAVISDRYVVIFDTLLSPTDMQPVMDWAGDALQAGRQLLVVNSHADWDHCWGNSYFTAPIIAHELCQERMRSEEARRELGDFQDSYDALFDDVALTPPTLTFSDSLTISGGDLTLELFSAPGHSDDSIAAWIPELRLLLAFDAVEFPIPIIDSAESVEEMFTTLEQFLELQPQRVLCSHGNSGDPGLVSSNLVYLREIEVRCLVVLKFQNLTDEELEQAPELISFPFSQVIARFPGVVDTPFYREAHAANIRAIMDWLLAERQSWKS
jgi:glyoxylase-like metal-dependent hydrolase (beta-lactamase superfamily II)